LDRWRFGNGIIECWCIAKSGFGHYTCAYNKLEAEKDLGSMELIDLGIGKVGDFPIKGNLVKHFEVYLSVGYVLLSLRKYVPWSDFDFVVALDPEIAFMLKKTL